MLKVQEIRELIKLIDQSSIDEFEYEFQGSKLLLKKQGQYAGAAPNVSAPAYIEVQPQAQIAPAPAAPAVKEPQAATEMKEQDVIPVAKENLVEIVSPMVGTFYQSPSPDAEPYVKAGSKVSSSTVVCIVEAMKLFNEIEAEVQGEIVEILVKDGELVEYGQPLFRVKPE
ncbi:acetyl-CoA carboxylase biotin carboxyl carrier protein [Bacillus oleivorans]|uniref:Biotin carboxyl carrier protein of acetyl-CoA carboxylase n=1 Tax=Bacillus oleivorans TaxID=1448271 RepID=A0A285CKD2_9BACI|nr:acetyl-CoA carboxylase biotin carboxyl carrier protein [Bacillus oleivorans]SNX67969.1 acetyl-CoA carboxylase biotin carboxyl carrier protein [Bacillus oleivorans]